MRVGIVQAAAGLCLLLTASGPCSGARIETVTRALAQVPESALSDWLAFEFVSPRAFASRSLDPIGRQARSIFVAALRAPEAARQMTGIDILQLDGILEWGPPGNEVTFLTGPREALQGVGEALTRRGFAKSAEQNLTVYAIGDDGSILNQTTTDPVDPFGRGLGRAERIALSETELIEANNSDALRQFLTAINSGSTAHYAKMAAASVSATVADADILRVLGLTPLALASPPVDPDALARLDPKSREALNLHRLQERPSKVMAAMFILGASSRGGIAELAVAYPDRATAASATISIKAGLQDFVPFPRPSNTVISTKLIELGPEGQTAGIASLQFPPAPPDAAEREVGAWIDATTLRDPNFLAIFR